MTDIPPPSPEQEPPVPLEEFRDPQSHLGFDELIALFVAFLSIGAILLWGWSRRSTPGFFASLPFLSRTAPSAVASPTVSPTAPTAITPIAPRPNAGFISPSPTVQPSAQPALPIPFVIPSPQSSVAASPSPLPRTEFPDVPQDFWATPFITELARRGIVEGFPDTTFRPDQPVTRAEFAVMLEKAFARDQAAQAVNFADVPANYWGNRAIAQATQSGFMRGYPNNQFLPDQQIPKEQALIALNTGLKLPVPQTPAQIVSIYQDADKISPYAVPAIAAATQANLVVSHPDPKFLMPQLTTSRAEAAALIYQALLQRQQVPPIQSEFIVRTNQ